MPKKKTAAESAKTETVEDRADASLEASAAAAGLTAPESTETASTELSTVGSELDETDAQNAAETSSMRKELEALRRENQNLQSRLSAVSQADQFIIQAELEATKAQDALADADKVRKDCKKKADAALENLRKVVRDRMSGQTLFSFAAGPVGATDPAIPVAPALPAAAAKPAETPAAAPACGNGDPVWDARIGSVSVKSADSDEMLSVPAGTVDKLVAAGLTTVRAVWTQYEAKNLKVKGIGDAKMKELIAVLTDWIKTAAPVASIAAVETAEAPATAAPVSTEQATREQGEPTHRGCGQCSFRWPLPSDVEACPECGEAELVYEIGYFAEPKCDDDGDFVVGIETVTQKGDGTKWVQLKNYTCSIMVAEGADGLWRNGWEIQHPGFPGDTGVYPSILRGLASPDRRTALQLAFGGLAKKMREVLTPTEVFETWLEAAKARFGVEPLETTDAKAAEAVQN